VRKGFTDHLEFFLYLRLVHVFEFLEILVLIDYILDLLREVNSARRKEESFFLNAASTSERGRASSLCFGMEASTRADATASSAASNAHELSRLINRDLSPTWRAFFNLALLRDLDHAFPFSASRPRLRDEHTDYE